MENSTTTTIVPCTDMGNDLENAGKFIKASEAKASLLSYFSEPGTLSPDDPNHIYGYTYGINKLRTLLSNIDQYNKGQAGTDSEIKAIRIYHGMSVRHDANFPLNPPDGCFKDLFIIAVRAKGDDFYDVNRLDEEEVILSESRPCPNQCGLTIYEIDKKENA
ncbi:hypothetical protein [Pedobacter punctiformis]|uniref:Uncharacterized protein n=1 Tax=Pedobacter punctiformis TaxID=3004097 RepID=A0ABT4LB07_9SPHI|nr:hypothetical protein [Pedobacter sp. HCMS5-2]MCZ4245107.1 hypothetical protein [Pedobacter sp. HCMS5-2]